MGNNNFRVLVSIEHIDYIFSTSNFREEFVKCYNKKKEIDNNYKKEYLKAEIANATSVEIDSVKKWYSGSNGPGDIQMVKKIAEVFKIDYMNIVKQANRKHDNNRKIEKVNNPDDQLHNELLQDERQIILNFYKELYKLAELDCLVFENDIKHLNSDDIPNLLGKHSEITEELYRYLDINALIISEETYKKLHLIITENDISFCGVDGHGIFSDRLERWHRINPFLDMAEDYCIMSGWYDEVDDSDEDEIRDKLLKDFNPNLEHNFCVRFNNYPNFHLSGLHAEDGVDLEKYRKRIQEIVRNEDTNNSKIEFLQEEDSYHYFNYIFHAIDFLKYEYFKTLRLLFKEDFPQYFK